MCGQPGRRTTTAHAPAPSHVSPACRSLLQGLVHSYSGDTHRLLTDWADTVGASIAYVDRPTVEAHLERPLSDGEWSAVAAQFTAMAFDEHVGDAGTLRTDWIEDRLHCAGVPGRIPHATPRSGSSRPPRRR